MDRPGAPATPASAQGDLHSYPLPRLLFHLLRNVFTGILALERPEGGAAQVFFRDGLPCYADLPSLDDVLGRVLVERGWIDGQQYNESLQQLSMGGKLHGQILLEMGAIDEAKLVDGLRLQLRRKLNRLFYYGPTTRFAIYNQQHPYGHHAEAAHVRVDPLFVIYQGVRNAFMPEQLASELIKLRGTLVQLHPHFDSVRARFGLSQEEEILLAVLAAGAVANERIYQISNLSATETQMLLYVLLVSDMIVVHANPNASAHPTVPASAPMPAQPVMMPQPAQQPVMTPQQRVVPPEALDYQLETTQHESRTEDSWDDADPDQLVDEPAEPEVRGGTMDGLPSIGALAAQFAQAPQTSAQDQSYGADAEGYDAEGFDAEGFDAEGFDADGFDAESFDIEGFDREGFDREGFDREGFDREGFDREGFDVEGYDREGYPAEGFVTEGYGRDSEPEPLEDDGDAGPLTIDLGDEGLDAPSGPARPAMITPPPPDDLGTTGPRPLQAQPSSPGLITPAPPTSGPLRPMMTGPLKVGRSSPGLITPPPPDDLGAPLQAHRSSPGMTITPPPPSDVPIQRRGGSSPGAGSGPIIAPPPPDGMDLPNGARGAPFVPPPPSSAAPVIAPPPPADAPFIPGPPQPTGTPGAPFIPGPPQPTGTPGAPFIPGPPQTTHDPLTAAAQAEPTPAKAAALSPQKAREADQHRQMVLDAFESTKDADLFTILKVDSKASSALIKEAYFGLAKQFHPDKISGLGLVDVAEQAAEVFRRINEAHIVLSDPEQRKEYQERLERGTTDVEEQAQVRQALEAEFAFQKGTVFFRKKDFRSALGEFKQAFKLAPDEGEHLAWVAWTVFCDPKTKREPMLPKLKQQFLEAVRLSPTSAASHYFLGSIYLEMNEEKRATTCFKKAIDLQPNHVEAQRQLRILQMRRERAGGDKKGLFGGDLFGRFKKK